MPAPLNSIEFEPGHHSKDAVDIYDTMWPPEVAERVRNLDADVLGVDGITYQLVKNELDNFHEGGEWITNVPPELLWATLPVKPTQLPPGYEQLIVAADWFHPRNQPDQPLILHSLGGSLFAGAIGGTLSAAAVAGFSYHKLEQPKAVSQLMSRRHFLSGLGALGAGAAIGVSLREAVQHGSGYLGPGSVQDMLETVDRAIPAENTPLDTLTERQRAYLDGRTALASQKVEDTLERHGLEKGGLVFGAAHTEGSEVVNSKTKRAAAIRRLARQEIEEALNRDFPNGYTDEQKAWVTAEIVGAMGVVPIIKMTAPHPETISGQTIFQLAESCLRPFDLFESTTLKNILADL